MTERRQRGRRGAQGGRDRLQKVTETTERSRWIQIDYRETTEITEGLQRGGKEDEKRRNEAPQRS